MHRNVLVAAALCAAAVGVAQADTLWDTGAPHPVMFNGASTYLGYSSGNLGAGLDQRWAAIPFRIDAAGGAVITDVDVNYFVAAGQTPDRVDYVIWRRTGLNAPVAGDEVSMGTLGVVDAGLDDPRIPVVDNYLHVYSGLNIALAAGDYYFTVYGAGGLGVNNTIAWLTGGDLQDESLEQAFMWRSTTFPAPGFAAYAPPNIVPVDGQDPGDLWNPGFVLRGTIPSPGAAALLGVSLIAVRRRRA